jgi:hypothetical protein
MKSINHILSPSLPWALFYSMETERTKGKRDLERELVITK